MSNNKTKSILLESGTNEVEFLQFKTVEIDFGINVSKVSQVVLFEDSKIIKLPNTSKSVIGSFFIRAR